MRRLFLRGWFLKRSFLRGLSEAGVWRSRRWALPLLTLPLLTLLLLVALGLPGLRWSLINAAPAHLSAAPERQGPAAGGAGTPVASARQIPVGMMVTQLYNFKPATSSFDAELWLWSVAPPQDGDPLKTSSFINAYSTLRSPEKRFSVQTSSGESIHYLQKIRGTFHHEWKLIHFPFDHQHLKIVLEEDERELQDLRLIPDALNSRVDAEIAGEWRLVGWSFRPMERLYKSSFGSQQEGPQPSSRYSRLEMTIDLARGSIGPLWRLCAAPMAAVVIVLVTYFIHLGMPGALPARGGLIGAALFAVIVSLRAASGEIDDGSPLTLIESLHLLAITYIMVGAAVTAVLTFLQARSVPDAVITRWDLRAALISSLVLVPFVMLNFLGALRYH